MHALPQSPHAHARNAATPACVPPGNERRPASTGSVCSPGRQTANGTLPGRRPPPRTRAVSASGQLPEHDATPVASGQLRRAIDRRRVRRVCQQTQEVGLAATRRTPCQPSGPFELPAGLQTATRPASGTIRLLREPYADKTGNNGQRIPRCSARVRELTTGHSWPSSCGTPLRRVCRLLAGRIHCESGPGDSEPARVSRPSGCSPVLSISAGQTAVSGHLRSGCSPALTAWNTKQRGQLSARHSEGTATHRVDRCGRTGVL